MSEYLNIAQNTQAAQSHCKYIGLAVRYLYILEILKGQKALLYVDKNFIMVNED